MMTKIRQFLCRLSGVKNPVPVDYLRLLTKCRAQETTILKLLHRESMRVDAATELCRDYYSIDELGNYIQTEEQFIAFADRRARTLTGKD